MTNEDEILEFNYKHPTKKRGWDSDATELTGDISGSRIRYYNAKYDPRVFYPAGSNPIPSWKKTDNGDLNERR